MLATWKFTKLFKYRYQFSYRNKIIHRESNKALKFITIILLHLAYTLYISVDIVFKVKKKKLFKMQTKR